MILILLFLPLVLFGIQCSDWWKWRFSIHWIPLGILLVQGSVVSSFFGGYEMAWNGMKWHEMAWNGMKWRMSLNSKFLSPVTNHCHQSHFFPAFDILQLLPDRIRQKRWKSATNSESDSKICNFSGSSGDLPRARARQDFTFSAFVHPAPAAGRAGGWVWSLGSVESFMRLCFFPDMVFLRIFRNSKPLVSPWNMTD